MTVSLSVRMNAEISETIIARLLRFGVQIPELPMNQGMSVPSRICRIS